VDRLHGHPRAPLPLQYECISFPSFMSGLHLRARECHSRQERMVRSLWRLPALSERARKAATERERLHMCVHNVRGGHMWREQHTFSSAVWQAQRARAEHLELHGFGLVLFISFLYNPFLSSKARRTWHPCFVPGCSTYNELRSFVSGPSRPGHPPTARL
jgi:hypothetical protein